MHGKPGELPREHDDQILHPRHSSLKRTNECFGKRTVELSQPLVDRGPLCGGRIGQFLPLAEQFRKLAGQIEHPVLFECCHLDDTFPAGDDERVQRAAGKKMAHECGSGGKGLLNPGNGHRAYLHEWLDGLPRLCRRRGSGVPPVVISVHRRPDTIKKIPVFILHRRQRNKLALRTDEAAPFRRACFKKRSARLRR